MDSERTVMIPQESVGRFRQRQRRLIMEGEAVLGKSRPPTVVAELDARPGQG
jgi:hypothetical protein